MLLTVVQPTNQPTRSLHSDNRQNYFPQPNLQARKFISKPQDMLPLFGDERRREINLGGSSSVTTSQAAILNQARARRIERETVRKRQDSAVTIQAWWRGITDSRRVRQELRELFTGDITGLTGLRCLVLIGQDTDFLDKWAVEVLSQGTRLLYDPMLLPNNHSPRFAIQSRPWL